MVNTYQVKFRLIGRKYDVGEYDSIGVRATTKWGAIEAARREFVRLGLSVKTYGKVRQENTPLLAGGVSTPVK